MPLLPRYVLVAKLCYQLPLHHGFLGKSKCLQNSGSHPGNTWYYQWCEGSGQPRIQLQTDFMAAHIPHWTVPLFPGFYFHNPNPLPYNQLNVIATTGMSAALLYNHNTSTQLHSPRLQAPGQTAQDSILVDPFWPFKFGVGPMGLSNLIPPDFPPHIDSIRAESFSRYMPVILAPNYQGNIFDMLNIFRQKIIFAYGGNMDQVPSTFSITRAINFDHTIPIQFGVSAPYSQSQHESRIADLVRSYRVRQCWGEQQPPPKLEGWKHGQCAENQSLSSVVAHCASLGLKNVIIYTLAMNKRGEIVRMCGNCRSYVSLSVLRKHPTWKVIDNCTRETFSRNSDTLHCVC